MRDIEKSNTFHILSKSEKTIECDLSLTTSLPRKLAITAIGVQGFDDIIMKNYFYVDKTNFIKEWWESGNVVTLITRPRRFGKTLTMSMVECFFSIHYQEKGEKLFKKLDIWKEPYYQQLQGTYPVINLSFSEIKGKTFENTRASICKVIANLYEACRFLQTSGILSRTENIRFEEICENAKNMDDVDASFSLRELSEYLYRYYGKRVIILLDEYDTPMQEAYVNGYWEELVDFLRGLFGSTFKANRYLERAIMTGITRVSKESIFSDLNNLKVITSTSNEYATTFGFTEEEVLQALDEYNLSDVKEKTKEWYNGFTFGEYSNIYNPWSILNLLDTKKYSGYWTNTSSNALIKNLIQKSSRKVKEKFEKLLQGETIQELIDEQIVFNQLDTNPSAIWSLLLASGYLKLVTFEDETTIGGKRNCWLAVTNKETMDLFYGMVYDWFSNVESYNDFINALLENDVENMNDYMNDIALKTFSSFDGGKQESEKTEPERFYHGFVLGLLVELRGKYSITSNRESGRGRYDITLKPLNSKEENAYIFEFKVFHPKKDKTLERTAQVALEQIRENAYTIELVTEGYQSIHTYGFAFRGKEVLIEKGE